MRVRVIAHTNISTDVLGMEIGEGVVDTDALAEYSGRLCYKAERKPNPKTRENRDYVRNIIDQQHTSVLEHVTVTFGFSDVSRSLMLELERHRFLSWSVRSTRYVDESDSGMVTPPLAEGDEWAERVFLHVQETAREAYKDLVQHFLNKGYKRKEARECARSVLPGNWVTEGVVTSNVRSWRQLIERRIDPSADREAQRFARQVLTGLQSVCPNLVQDLTEKFGSEE